MVLTGQSNFKIKVRLDFDPVILFIILAFYSDSFLLDWEYPADNREPPGTGPSDKVYNHLSLKLCKTVNLFNLFKTKEKFISLLSELKTALAPHGFMLAVAVASGKDNMETAYIVPAMAKYVKMVLKT